MSIRWRGLAGRVVSAVIFGGIGLFLLLVVVMFWQSPDHGENWLAGLSIKMFFLLLLGSIAGYAFRIALGGSASQTSEPPPALAEVCPACGHLASGGAAVCTRCGLGPAHRMHWEESNPGTHVDDLLLACMLSSPGFLGLFMLAKLVAGEVHGAGMLMNLVIGLVLGAFGLSGPIYLISQVRDRRRTRGRYTVKFTFSSESNLWTASGTAQLDRHDQIVSAEGTSTWRSQNTTVDPAQLAPRRTEVLRALARLERHCHVAVITTRRITWSRQVPLPRVERFDYRVRTSDEAWTCHEQLRPRFLITSGTEEEQSPTRIHGWTKPDAGRIKRLSEVLAIEIDHEVNLDEVLDRLDHDDARRDALLAIADEVAALEGDDDDDDDDEAPPAPVDERLERRVSELAGWLFA